MVEPDDAAWTARSTRLEAFRCDTLFAVRTTIRFCDEVTGRLMPGAAMTLPMPDLPLVEPEYAAASDLLDRKGELARHYRRVVIAYAGREGLRQPTGGSPDFWLRPAIVAGGEVVSSFVWYDTVDEATALLQALRGAPEAADGELWDDLDQGWRVRVVKLGQLVHVAEWNWEDDDAVPSAYAFDSAALAREAEAALGRMQALHGFLVDVLGFDYWTRRRP